MPRLRMAFPAVSNRATQGSRGRGAGACARSILDKGILSIKDSCLTDVSPDTTQESGPGVALFDTASKGKSSRGASDEDRQTHGRWMIPEAEAGGSSTRPQALQERIASPAERLEDSDGSSCPKHK